MVALPQLLTHSRMQSFKSCPKRHWYAYEKCLRRIDTGAPLRMGSAFHDALEAADLADDDSAGFDVIHQNYEECPEWMDQGEWDIEREKTLRLFAGHQWRWSGERFRVIATEREFCLPLVNPDTGEEHPRFNLAGKIDRIVELPDGRMAVQEYKTTGDAIGPDSDYWTKLRIDGQISTYMIAARMLGFDVQTVIYDVTKKPGINPKKLTKKEQAEHGVERETVAMYGERLNADFVARPDFYFARREIPRLADDLERFRDELWHVAEDLAQHQDNGWHYRNPGACRSPYPCSYLSVCADSLDPAVDGVPDGWTVSDTRHPELSPQGVSL